ncbi:hypothetical protein C8J56DRAFT_889145 [Mycena floridula]|nr:hypothetical protein C8J56DRAFT_889145 [Mycena floridula]
MKPRTMLLITCLSMVVQGPVLAQGLAGTNSTLCDPGPCTPVNNVSGCVIGSITCFCTQTYFDAYLPCFECAVRAEGSGASLNATTDQEGKTALINLAKSCAAAGIPGLTLPDFTTATKVAGPTATVGEGQPAASGAPTSTKNNDASDLKVLHFQAVLIIGYVPFLFSV